MDYLCRPLLNQGTENIDKNPAHRMPPNPEDFTSNSPKSLKSQEFRFCEACPVEAFPHSHCLHPLRLPSWGHASRLCPLWSRQPSRQRKTRTSPAPVKSTAWPPCSLLCVKAHLETSSLFSFFFITIEMNRTESNEHQPFPCKSRQETVQSVFPSSSGPQSPIEELHDGQAQSRLRSFLQSACFQERPVANYFKRRVLFSYQTPFPDYLSPMSAAVGVFPQLRGVGEQNYVRRLHVLRVVLRVSISPLLLRRKNWTSIRGFDLMGYIHCSCNLYWAFCLKIS